MPLHVGSLTFRDFRSYESFTLDDIGDLTIVVGPNAAGKTNIIEGIQLLSALASFRNATIEQLVRHGRDFGHLEYSLSGDDRMLDVSLDLKAHSKAYALNGKRKQAADLRGLMPAVVFTPDDLDLVKGAMSLRRRALDLLGAQLNANYHIIRKDYEKILAHKNRLLKEEASDLMLDSIDEMVATCGATLCAYRASLFARLAPHIANLYGDIAEGKDTLGAIYRVTWEGKETTQGEESASADDMRSLTAASKDELKVRLQQALETRRAEERARKRAVVGPQGDRIEFFIDGYDASVFGSQGQQRSLVLAQKLAEARVIEEVLDKKPLLLLDDVMSELDERRRAALVEHLQDGVQTFITTANLSYFSDDMLEGARIVKIGQD